MICEEVRAQCPIKKFLRKYIAIPRLVRYGRKPEPPNPHQSQI